MRRRRARLAAATVAAAGALAVWTVSHVLFPYHSLNHDEAVYLQQATMLLEGQLNLWPPVEGVFRPWFFVDAGERLYPKYAPAPAAMFALGKLAGGYRLALAGVAGGILALTYGVASEAFDRRTGLLAAAFVLASPLFLIDAAVFLPYAPTALLNFAFAYAYLRGDRTESVRWAALAGAAIGLAFFARPYTAVLFAAPFLAHAAWTLRRERATIASGGLSPTFSRRAATAALGLAGVALALTYNAVVTGSPTTFPYQAFAPQDGLGFGARRLLGHGVEYTPDLALRANAEVVSVLFGRWVAGGPLGTALALAGLGIAVARRHGGSERGLDARRAALAGIGLSVIAGNVYFWGNYNVLGDLARAGDGLIAALGPYYHFDVLLPTAAFAARGVLASIGAVRRLAGRILDPGSGRFRVAVVAALLVGAAVFGAATASALADPVARNAEVTETYERAYQPFEERSLENAVVFVPAPYGEWLNHPFQALRNDPGFDGPVVYALDDRPFAVADAFPDRTPYRYAFRGPWAPSEGSPSAARLQRLRDVSGAGVTLEAALGIPPGARSVTVRLGTDDGTAYYVRDAGDDRNDTRRLDLRVRVAGRSVALGGDVRGVGNTSLGLGAADTVRVTAFVDYAAGGFSYRLDVPTRTDGRRVRALSPRVEYCRNARACGGAAAYVPGAAPEGVFVRTNLSTAERNP